MQLNSIIVHFQVSYIGIWSWITYCWITKDTLSLRITECARRASGRATTPAPFAALPITSLLRFYVAKNIASQWIGGLWGSCCMRCWQAVAPSILLARPKTQTRTPRISYSKLFWRRPYVYRDLYPLRLRLFLKDFFARIPRKGWAAERDLLVSSTLSLIPSLRQSIGKW